MKTSQVGIALIKFFEKCRLVAYQDGGGVWTIGWGHTHDVHPGDTCTSAEADELLAGDLIHAEEDVARLVRVPLAENEHAALVSWFYNLGAPKVKNSTLLRLLNQMRYAEAAEEFLKWVSPGSANEAGLTRRREAERKLFLT